ncbi:hemerythrin domain-containing protein [Rhizobium alvei]|uniref:Hemerythrin-like domain-containing protein n=1 Tax=Rhizobium alvei TaxID=1132659 RepID=A0ABT8YNK0_9HYPH|nr:hypothetical protein [Rhizobium alvei]MDO6964795.1 hypothetical protein [Rhizobium alvei]
MSHHIAFDQVPPTNGRYDLYGAVHKGLRRAQCDLLGRLGAADRNNATEIADLMSELRGLLRLAAAHVVHEDREIHGRLQSLSVSTATLDDQHEDHRIAFGKLEAMIVDVEKAPAERKQEKLRHLYLAFAAYVAEDLEHMHEEETVTAPALWANLDDQALAEIEMRIVGSMAPDMNMAFMRIMIPAMNPDERLALLAGIRKVAPPEAFHAVLEFAARPSLSVEAFRNLTNSLEQAA